MKTAIASIYVIAAHRRSGMERGLLVFFPSCQHCSRGGWGTLISAYLVRYVCSAEFEAVHETLKKVIGSLLLEILRQGRSLPQPAPHAAVYLVPRRVGGC